MKRRLSPSWQSSKRSQSGRGRESTTGATIYSLYDELILSVFSHLSWADLCVAQATSRTWARLATDNQLWKALYLQECGRSRLRGARGFIGRTDGKPVRSLPGRATADTSRDWKTMFRISSNWRTGRCAIELLDHTKRFSDTTTPLPERSEQTHVLLAGQLTIIASSHPSLCPAIQLRSPNGIIHSLFCTVGNNQHPTPTHITALALDQSPPDVGHHLRLSAFLSSGRINVFDINHNHPSRSIQSLAYTPLTPNSRTAPIIQAVYHHPLLITLSEVFHLSIYDLSSGSISHRQTLSSFTSFPPSSLVLSTPSPSIYKLVLAYAIPVYPKHWSVGATELVISANTPAVDDTDTDIDADPEDATSHDAERPSMSVITTRTTRTFDAPNGWIDERKLKLMREQWGRKVFRVADTQTDGKWVVLAPATATEPASSFTPSPSSLSPTPPPSPPGSGQSISPFGSGFASSDMYSPNILQLYRLSMPTTTGSVPKLVFVRNLLGPLGAVSTLSLSDGRCVGLAANGSLWVWDLESGSGVEVAGARRCGVGKGSVVFDERRIVSSGVEGVVIRRFDI